MAIDLKFAAFVVIGFGLAAPAVAQTSPWAIGATVGTDGIGGEVKYALSPNFILRGRATGLDFSDTETSDGLHYNGKAKLGIVGAYLDWHPMRRSGFLLSAGLLGGKRQMDLSGSSANNVTLRGHSYTPAQIGTVSGRAKLSSPAGFVGLGYDSTFVHPGRIGFNVLLGAQLSGSPSVHLGATGLLATAPQLRSDLNSEEAEIRSDFNFTRYYPALSVGLSYRF